jgi:uncharacterized membrane protein YfcA
MSSLALIAAGLLLLAVLSGMLGLGVAFAAVPFLGLFFHDLVHEVQPLSLALNGVTALTSAIGFAQSGYIDWRRAGLLALVTTVTSPFGAWLAQYTPQVVLWAVYLAAVGYLAWRLLQPSGDDREGSAEPRFRMALILAVPIAVLAGLLGVGPGFLLMPTLILVGFDSKLAAGINAVAVTPPSFSSLIPHLPTAKIDLQLAAILIVVGAVGSFLGARLTSLYVPSARLKQIFGVLIVVMTAYKLWTLVA